MKIRNLWQVFRLTLGVVLPVLAFQQVDWQAVRTVLAQTDWLWAFLALLSFLITLLLKVMRWGWLTGVSLRTWFGKLLGAFLIGQAANILLPVRGGEVIRLGWLATQIPKDAESSPSSLELTTWAGVGVVMEKYLDLASLLILLFILLPFLPSALLERTRTWLLPLCVLASLLVLSGLWILPAAWKKMKPILERRFSRNFHKVDPWFEKITHLRASGRLFPAVAITLLIWPVMWLTNLLTLRALNLPITLPGAALALALIYAGLIPAAMPGNFGPFYFFAMQGLAPFGIPPGGQAAFAILLHLLVTVPPLVLAGGLQLIPHLGKREAA